MFISWKTNGSAGAVGTVETWLGNYNDPEYAIVAKGHGNQGEVAGRVLKLEVGHHLGAFVSQGPDVNV